MINKLLLCATLLVLNLSAIDPEDKVTTSEKNSTNDASAMYFDTPCGFSAVFYPHKERESIKDDYDCLTHETIPSSPR